MHIISAFRTPMGSFQGVFKDLKATDLGSIVLAAARGEVNPEWIDEVIMGCVLSAGLGQAPARQASLKSGQRSETPALTINKMCGSGMKALMLGADAIALGRAHLVLAGGMESMTNAPYLLTKARSGYRFGHGEILDHMALDGLEDAYSAQTPMGLLAERLVDETGFSKQDQDAFALLSLEKARRAISIVKSEIVAVHTQGRDAQIIMEDEPLSRAKPEKIPSLKPVFKKDGTITAASASGITDGAAAVLLASDEALLKHGLTSRARILGQAQFSGAPEDFAKAPVGAISKLLTQLGWDVSSVDLFEVNEAFAVVPMHVMNVFGIDEHKMNIHGGACALGHPIGASGARVVVTLLHALEHYQLKRGIAVVCIGGGESVAIAIER